MTDHELADRDTRARRRKLRRALASEVDRQVTVSRPDTNRSIVDYLIH